MKRGDVKASGEQADGRTHAPGASSRPFRPLLLPLLIAALAGCAGNREHYDTPDVPLPDRYHHAAEAAVPPADPPARSEEAATPAPPLPDRRLAEWWRLFENEELDALVDRALANNQQLRIAAQRVVQAKARSAQARADRLPLITAPAQHRIEAPEDGIGSVAPGGELKTRHTYQASLRGDWRVDLWGERRSLHESAELDLWQAIFQHDNRRRTLVAEVVDAYVEYLSLNDRMRVARRTEQVLQEMLEAMEARLERGDATVTDLEQQRAAVHSVRATLPTLELRREQISNRLSLLVGGVPRGLDLSPEGLDVLHELEAVPGIPSSLLLHRPDVRAAEARLLAADADVDVARARLLPPLDLTAQVGYGSYHLAQLFEPHALFWEFIANLSATIFDAGKGEREVEYARALHEELVENYVRVIYTAVLEVEDALATIDLSRKRLAIQRAATDAAEHAWRYSRESYGAGAIDYLTLLDTARTHHRNLDDLHRFRMETYQGLAELFAALGGGVESRSPMPYDGERPQREEGVEGEAAGGDDALELPAEERWRPFTWRFSEKEIWLVELSGIHTRDGAEATWRDLRNRYPAMVGGRALLARVAQETVEREGQQGTWYRLFVEGFDDREAARHWCETLRSEQQRCRVLTSEAEQAFAGRLPWPEAPAEATRLPDQIPPNEAAAMGYAVQLASFKKEARARRALKAWRAKGYHPFISRIENDDGRRWHAVRLAPLSSREAAERDALELNRREKAKSIVVPQSLDPEGVSARLDGFAVQVGYFSSHARAEAAAAAWRTKGYAPYLHRHRHDEGEPHYSVRLAPAAERAAADRAMAEFSRREEDEAIIVEQPLDGLSRPLHAMGYALQVGTFRRLDGALRTTSLWRNQGYTAYTAEVTGNGEAPWYTVRLAASPQRDWVHAKALELEQQEGVKPLVVPVELDSRGDPARVVRAADQGGGDDGGDDAR